MVATSLLTVLLFCSAATTVSTSPIILNMSPVSIPLMKRLDLARLQGGCLLKGDQTRAQALRARVDKARDTSGPVKLSPTAIVGNEPVNDTAVTYLAAVGVGTPAIICVCHKDYICAADLINIFRSVGHRHGKVRVTAKF
jgi:cathepsin E